MGIFLCLYILLLLFFNVFHYYSAYFSLYRTRTAKIRYFFEICKFFDIPQKKTSPHKFLSVFIRHLKHAVRFIALP